MADDRDKLVKTYRELEGHELLTLYAKREDLSPVAVEVLREELRLRGLDPDSLRPTVPRARTDDEPGEEGPRDASLAESQLPEIPEELRGEYDPSTSGWLSCPACGAPNLSSETHCRSCRAPLGEAPPAPEAEPGAITPGGPHPGTLASATLGLVGISGLLFSAYIAMLDVRAVPIAVLAAVAGAVSIGLSIALYSRSRTGA